jgi:hypothetical protein
VRAHGRSSAAASAESSIGASTGTTEFDEDLVRRLIEKINVFSDHFTVEFKSGVSVDIKE